MSSVAPTMEFKGLESPEDLDEELDQADVGQEIQSKVNRIPLTTPKQKDKIMMNFNLKKADTLRNLISA